MISVQQLVNSFKYALKGLKHVYTHEQNFKIQVFFAIWVLILIVALRVELLRAALLILLCLSVLTLELLNTVVERFIDLLRPRLHEYVQVIKDLMAAAVLIASLGALLVGVLILWPYLVNLWLALE